MGGLSSSLRSTALKVPGVERVETGTSLPGVKVIRLGRVDISSIPPGRSARALVR